MWTAIALYTFTGSLYGGGGTRSGVTINGGKVYGTSLITASNAGTVFRLTPPAKLGGAWKHDVLYTFLGGSGDGANPWSNLVFDSMSNLYGPTQLGGIGNCVAEACGTIYRLTPAASLPWTETILYTFEGGSDGANPVGNITFGLGGLFYGATFQGGTGSCTLGCGAVFSTTH